MADHNNRPIQRRQQGPAAGDSGGKAPYPAKVNTPSFLWLNDRELHVLLDVLRHPLCTQVFLIILSEGIFTTGEYLGSYARLEELCTPPIPERGARMKGPSYKQVRKVVDDLIAQGLLWRNANANLNHGQLRLKFAPRTVDHFQKKPLVH